MRRFMKTDLLTGSIVLSLSLFFGACSDDNESSNSEPSTTPSADAATSEVDTGPEDNDNDGFAGADDCDDTNPNIHPDADEVCDGVDNNCDGAIDGDDAVDRPNWYLDGDGDGFGVTAEVVVACEAPEGYASKAGDCADDDEDINPSADEICGNAVDENCNDEIDDHGSIGEQAWYRDRDNDGYGGGRAVYHCGPPSEDGYTHEGGDCDDGDSDVYPGSMTEEVPEDGIDQNCNGSDDE